MPPDACPQFRRVVRIALALPGVELATRYDGVPVLRLRGCFMAAPASHPSADADSLVVRADLDARALWLEEAPDMYYVTAYYSRHPVILVRTARLDDAALRDVLTTSWRLTSLKTPARRLGHSQSARSILPGPTAGRSLR
jgi:hypothetical protein